MAQEEVKDVLNDWQPKCSVKLEKNSRGTNISTHNYFGVTQEEMKQCAWDAVFLMDQVEANLKDKESLKQ